MEKVTIGKTRRHGADDDTRVTLSLYFHDPLLVPAISSLSNTSVHLLAFVFLAVSTLQLPVIAQCVSI